MKVTSWRVGLIAILISLGAARSTYAQSQSFQFRCDEPKVPLRDQESTFQATFLPEQSLINLDDGRTLLMPQVVAASGTRYKNAGYIFSNKGNKAFITLNAQVIYQRSHGDY